MSDIEWTDRTWNPIVGCTRVSPGCEHCYAERFVHRGMAPQHRGLTVLGRGEKGPRWTGEVRLVESALAKPLSWKKPARVFVNSLSDLWHEGVSNETCAAIFGVMAACPHLTFQVLTKRPERMRVWFRWIESHETYGGAGPISPEEVCQYIAIDRYGVKMPVIENDGPWPLPNVWLGVTAEDQQRADERIPLLLDTPAAVRFVSYEPALGPVNFTRLDFLPPMRDPSPYDPVVRFDALRGHVIGPDEMGHGKIDWLIVGGESGPKARPMHVEWAASAVRQCKAAGVPVFVKQAGAHVITRNDDNFTIDEDPPDPAFPGWPMHLVHEDRIEHGDDRYQGAPVRVRLRHGKGADMSEWRSDLRVREFPT